MQARDKVNPIWNLFDAATRRQNVQLTCPRCPHSEVYHAAALWKLFVRHGWPDDLRAVTSRFYCPMCKRERGVRVKPVMALVEENHTMSLPMPTDVEWKRAIRRRR